MKAALITLLILLLGSGGGAFWYFFMRKTNVQTISIPYIGHQTPRIDPHIPSHIALADKLDEVVFDGLFNVSANASGIVYEDGLGELLGITEDNIVTVRLKNNRKWHSSYRTDVETMQVTEGGTVKFQVADLRKTMRRIQHLGSLSPDYILVSQAIENFDFSGPDENGEIKFKFKNDRVWTENDVKEVLSFKIIPENSDFNAKEYAVGTGPYLRMGKKEENIHFHQNMSGMVKIPKVTLRSFVDNSTFFTELKNKKINTILSTPFGAVSPLLKDRDRYFYKSNISTVYFAILYNVQKLNREQRAELRKLIDNKRIMDRFFKVGTPQQREIVDYKGNTNNYKDYLNFSVFPASSYYVDEKIVMPLELERNANTSVLPSVIKIQTNIDNGYKEELNELIKVINSEYNGKVKVEAVSNSIIRQGNYDAVLIPITGYRSNFLFDLYNVFLRVPNFNTQQINLKTLKNKKGERIIAKESFTENKNFMRIDLNKSSDEYEDFNQFLEYVYGFMSTNEVGDKQQYAQFVDEYEQKLALGSWLFSLPSLAYFRTQLDAESITLYGVASQLSTIEQWNEGEQKPVDFKWEDLYFWKKTPEEELLEEEMQE